MDRTVFSDPAVVTASRDFVCVRLSTYEDPDEAEFLRSIYKSPDGKDKNTVFALLSPEGKPETRTGRSPRQVLRTSDDETVGRLLSEMKRLAGIYPGRAVDRRALPTVANLRLAMNVAACELQPLLAVVAGDAKEREALEKRVADTVWLESLAGRFTIVSVSEPGALEGFMASSKEPSVLVLATDAYGLESKLLAEIPAKQIGSLEKSLLDVLDEIGVTAKDSRQHVRSGRRAGIEWETKLPATDSRGK